MRVCWEGKNYLLNFIANFICIEFCGSVFLEIFFSAICHGQVCEMSIKYIELINKSVKI